MLLTFEFEIRCYSDLFASLKRQIVVIKTINFREVQNEIVSFSYSTNSVQMESKSNFETEHTENKINRNPSHLWQFCSQSFYLEV